MSERAEIKLWGEPNPTQEYLDYIEAQKAKNDNQQEEDAWNKWKIKTLIAFYKNKNN